MTARFLVIALAAPALAAQETSHVAHVRLRQQPPTAVTGSTPVSLAGTMTLAGRGDSVYATLTPDSTSSSAERATITLRTTRSALTRGERQPEFAADAPATVRGMTRALAHASRVFATRADSLVGQWSVTYPADLQTRNGVLTPIMATGTLSVQLQGDSIVATLTSEPSAELPARPPQRLVAAIGLGDPVFVVRRPVTLSAGARTIDATSVSTWVFKPRGGRLAGTVDVRLEGIAARAHGPQPLSGVRLAR
jgi:hypothetical protein